MASATLPPPAPLDLTPGCNVSANWKKFKNAWCNYELATGLTEKSSEVRLATFLHVLGDKGLEKYESFCLPENDQKIEIVLEKFENDCKPQTNILIERYKFLRRKQLKTETVDGYVTQLRLLVDTCDYSNPNEALRDQLVLNMYDDDAREKILDMVQYEGKVPDLNQVIILLKNHETRKEQQCIRNTEEKVLKQKKLPTEGKKHDSKKYNPNQTEVKHVNVVHHDGRKRVKDANSNGKKGAQYHQSPVALAACNVEVNVMQSQVDKVINCKFCGNRHKYGACPSFGRKCDKCGKPNHTANVCGNIGN